MQRSKTDMSRITWRERMDGEGRRMDGGTVRISLERDRERGNNLGERLDGDGLWRDWGLLGRGRENG